MKETNQHDDFADLKQASPNVICTDPIYTWLPIKNSSVSIKISATILILFDNSKESYSPTRLVGLI